MLIPKSWFQEDWERALELKHALDCRAGKCHLCGVIYRERELCKHMLKRQKQGRIEEKDWQPTPKPEQTEPPAVQRLRFRIGRSGEARFLSHLELVNVWIRALRRARTPLSYSQGFHAHPRLNFASAPPVGEESRGDLMDVILKARVEPDALLARLQATLPEGIHAFAVEEVPLKAPALMASLRGHRYRIETDLPFDVIEQRVADVLASDRLEVERRNKKAKNRRFGRKRPATKSVDVRPMIAELSAEPAAGGAVVHLETRVVEKRGIRMREIHDLLALDPVATRVIKEASFVDPIEAATAVS
jgi:radical SAM-linked protein